MLTCSFLPTTTCRIVIRSTTLFSGEVLGAHKRDNTNYQESSTLELLQISQKKETNKTKWTGKYQLPVGKRSEPSHFFSSVLKHCERQCNPTTDKLHFFVVRLFGLFIMATWRQKCFLPVQRFCISIFTLSVENNISNYHEGSVGGLRFLKTYSAYYKVLKKYLTTL